MKISAQIIKRSVSRAAFNNIEQTIEWGYRISITEE